MMRGLQEGERVELCLEYKGKIEVVMTWVGRRVIPYWLPL